MKASPNVQYLVLTALAIVLMLLTGIDVALYASNVSIQREFSSNNQTLQQAAQRQSLYQEMVSAMTQMAIGRNDDQLKELLSRHGVSLASQPPAAFDAPGKQNSRAPTAAAPASKPSPQAVAGQQKGAR